ncbi:MAG: type IV secretory system conjugative DNA transfer family protein [Phycisphaerales bacterium]
MLGATGSGKSSTTGTHVARGMLHHGFGGLVLVAKEADGRTYWERLCRETGRQDDLVIISPESGLRFNPFDFELNRPGRGAGKSENVTRLLLTLAEAAEKAGSTRGDRPAQGNGDPFWKDSQSQMIRNSVELLRLATGSVSIETLRKLILSAPQSLDEARSEGWQNSSYCFSLLVLADERTKGVGERADLALAMDYFLLELPQLAARTRSIITTSVTALTDTLSRGVLRDLFGSGSDITPAASEEGKIILVDLPAKEFGEIGTIAGVIMKYCWQRSIERRDIRASPRPVFLFADEAQNFLTSYDMHFLATCRSVRVATVLLSQNVSNFYAALGGGDLGRSLADSMFANLNTKVLHANGDSVTNEWAANLIGKTRQFFVNAGNSQDDDLFYSVTGLGQSSRGNAGVSEQLDYEWAPSTFTALRTGGELNRLLVDAVVFRSGQPFTTGRNWLATTLRQDEML